MESAKARVTSVQPLLVPFSVAVRLTTMGPFWPACAEWMWAPTMLVVPAVKLPVVISQQTRFWQG